MRQRYAARRTTENVRLASLLMLLLGVLGCVLGGWSMLESIGPLLRMNPHAGTSAIWGLLLVLGGVVCIVLGVLVRRGDLLAWVVSLIIALIVMLRTWMGAFLLDLVDLLAFLLSLGAAVFLLLSFASASPR